MGVLGLVPFLQKHCPEVIKIFPNRLQALPGKTLAIDGTLITQRLHWAPIPHRYRHVLGWYRLISELRENNLKAICVFDGNERSAAKALETERRRYARRQTATRSTIEMERLTRLRKLGKLLLAYEALPARERWKTSEVLQALMARSQSPSVAKSFSGPILEAELYAEGMSVKEVLSPESFDESGYFDCTQGDADLGFDPSGEVLSEDVDSAAAWIQENMSYNQAFPEPTIAHEPAPSSQNIPNELASLYHEYQSSKTHTDILPPFLSKIKSLEDSTLLSSIPSERSLTEEISESKLQAILTQEEGQLWSVIESSVSQPDQDSASAVLSALADRSEILSQSYERRSRPPSQETYEESRVLLSAMGVPCVDCNGPYEAEGLASSLVLNGLADYVASEDTDVLVYGAPILRNVTSRRSALALISGSDVRTALDLSRESFIDFALLLGTDFSKRIRNVGPAKAYKLIRAHETIERIVDATFGNDANTSATEDGDKNYKELFRMQLSRDAGAREMYLAQIEVARNVFNTLPPVPDRVVVETRNVDRQAVVETLAKFGLSRAAADADWDPQAALAGNYFGDDPMQGSVVWK